MKKSLQLQSLLQELQQSLSLDMVMRHAAEQGYNPNDPTSYSYSYTIDQQGNYHYTWKGN